MRSQVFLQKMVAAEPVIDFMAVFTLFILTVIKMEDEATEPVRNISWRLSVTEFVQSGNGCFVFFYTS